MDLLMIFNMITRNLKIICVFHIIFPLYAVLKFTEQCPDYIVIAKTLIICLN